MKNRVVMTGASCVTSLGKGATENWKKILHNSSGIKTISRFDATQYFCPFAGEVTDDLMERVPVTGRSMMTPQNIMLLWSVMDAWEQSKLAERLASTKDDIRIFLGSGSMSSDIRLSENLINNSRDDQGGVDLAVFAKNVDKTPPLDIVRTMATVPNFFISKELGIHGLGNPIYNGDVSGLSAMINAARTIEAGDADVIIVGSAEHIITPFNYYHFSGFPPVCHAGPASHATELSRPFDALASGMVVGEASACVILESEAHALSREATPLAVVKPGAINLFPVAEDCIALSEVGFRKNLEATLALCHTQASEVDTIFPHGISYPSWDVMELCAIDTVWGNHIYDIVSVKGHIGFTGACAGLLDSVFAQQSLATGTVPPILNYTQLHPNAPARIQAHISSVGKQKPHYRCLVSGAGFGGFHASLILEQWRECRVQ